MARDIRDFSKAYKEKPAQNVKNMRRDDLNEQEKRQYDDIRSKAEQFEGKSEEELMGELFKRVGEGKKNGTLKTADLDRFAAQVAPMLNGEQREKLKNLLGMIK